MDVHDSRSPAVPLVDPGQIDHIAADMTVTFAADVTLPTLQARLAQHNQWLPIDGGVHEDGMLARIGAPELELPGHGIVSELARMLGQGGLAEWN